MIEIAIIVVLSLVIAVASIFSRSKLMKKRRKKALRGIDELSRVLDLIQRLQRHRGLCANLNAANKSEQQQLCMEVNRIWGTLLEKGYGGNVKRINVQHKNWQKIEASPANTFMPHCELIEKLLHELTVIADTCSLTASNNSHDNDDLWRNLLKRPQFAETLGRLRALGSKAASLGQCPADVRIQLQYQLVNLRNNELFDQNVKKIDDLVMTEILEPERIQIDSRVYFNRVTQAIDQQIQQTRDHLQMLS